MRLQESNPRPSALQLSALATELILLRLGQNVVLVNFGKNLKEMHFVCSYNVLVNYYSSINLCFTTVPCKDCKVMHMKK